MFLATTGLSEFWDEQERLLFLGSWCMRQEKKALWSRLKFQVLPSPWNNRERFYRAADFLDGCGERMLEHLAGRLNLLHGKEHPLRYWRILIGPWLVHHLHTLYDRYIHLQEAFQLDPSLTTFCLDKDSYRVPQDGSEHIEWILEDRYNLQLYSELLAQMGKAFPTRPYSQQGKSVAKRNGPIGKDSFLKNLQQAVLLPLKRRGKIALYETSLSRSMIWKLAWTTRFKALPLPLNDRWPSDFSKADFNGRRNSLADLPAQDEFEKLFIRMLPSDFPSLYLEGYAAARERTLRSFPNQASVLVSAIGWHFHEPFKWIAAEAALSAKRRLVALQHGGGYGIYRFTSMERHESRLSDAYLVWGWANGHGSPWKNVPAPQLSALKDSLRQRTKTKSGSILFVATTNPLYFYRFFSTPQGSQLEDYFGWQFQFLESISSTLRERVIFRPHSHPYAHGIRERLSERFPDLQWQNRASFQEALQSASVTVIDHLGTPMLESLAADRPTVLFWDPHRWEVRPEAQPYFEALREAGILWDSPKSAAGHLGKVAPDPQNWWKQEPVQLARRKFVELFAHCRSDWSSAWREILMEEAAKAESR